MPREIELLDYHALLVPFWKAEKRCQKNIALGSFCTVKNNSERTKLMQTELDLLKAEVINSSVQGATTKEIITNKIDVLLSKIT